MKNEKLKLSKVILFLCTAKELSLDKTSNLPFNSHKSSTEALPAAKQMN